MSKINWHPITVPYMHGYETEWEGLNVELVRCYEDEWAVFLTRGDGNNRNVAACFVAERANTYIVNGQPQLSTKSPHRTLGEARRFALQQIKP